MELIFREAFIADLKVIVEIYNSTIASRIVTADIEPVSIESRINWFEMHNPETRPIWVVENVEGIVGWISFQDFYGRPAYKHTSEISIYLHENNRGRGYGRRILDFAISQCERLHIKILVGFIFSHNIPSIKLFKRAGFQEWGLLPDVAVFDSKCFNLSIYGLKISSMQ